MRKLILLVGMLLFVCATKSYSYSSNYDKGFSTWTVNGVVCSTGTAIDISISSSSTYNLLGYDIRAYRIQNQDATYAVWLRNDNQVSTTTAGAAKLTIGEKLVPGSNGVWELGINTDVSTTRTGNVRIWCKADDSAGANGVVLSRAIFGSK